MWHEGFIGVPQKDGSFIRVRYQVKSYAEGFEFGIDGGRISKLWLSIDGKEVANYDRGWDLRPTCEDAEFALAILMKDYN